MDHYLPLPSVFFGVPQLRPKGAALIFVNEMLLGSFRSLAAGFLCLHLLLGLSFWPFLVLSLLPAHLPVAG